MRKRLGAALAVAAMAATMLVVETVTPVPAGATGSASYTRTGLTQILSSGGGRVDWSVRYGTADTTIYLDDSRSGEVDRMHPDGTGNECVSCPFRAAGELPDTSYGQPAVDPTGRWVVVQVVKPGQSGPQTGPGAGLQNDLWVLDMATFGTASPQAYELYAVGEGNGRGTLHAQWSNSGRQLLWADLEYSNFTYDNENKVYPDSRLGVGNFVVDGSGVPSFDRVDFYDPLGDQAWYETAGWGPDDSWVYVTCTPAPDVDDDNGDICRFDFDNPTVITRLTMTSGTNGEAPEFDEHPHLSPYGDAFVWMTSQPIGSHADPTRQPLFKTDLWMMDVDGDPSSHQRLTFFNEPSHADYGFHTVPGTNAIVSDNDWSPDGSKVVMYVQYPTPGVAWERVYVLDLARSAPAVDVSAPAGHVSYGPRPTTTATSAETHFSGVDDVSHPSALSFQCSLNGAAYAPCTSPVSLSGLAQRTHRFSVKATDAAGNTDATPATWTWQVVASDPDPVWLSPTTDAPVAPGDGFETTPTLAYADGGGEAAAMNGMGERHLFSGFGATVPSGAEVTGIEVRVDWRSNDTLGEPSLAIDLSSDGVSWTRFERTPLYKAPAGEKVAVVGSRTEPWGRLWSAADVANLQVRVLTECTHTELCDLYKDTYLDWLAVKVHTETAADTLAPETTITSAPSGSVSRSANGAAFVTDDPTATTECSLDGAPWSPCTSPVGFGELAFGPHSLAVRATDTNGNVEPDPAVATWTVVNHGRLIRPTP